MSYPLPPAHVAPYVEALGPETAIEFFLHFGGAELFIPVTPRPTSRLVLTLGMDAALALASLNENFPLPGRVPIPKPWIARYWKWQGLSQADICRRLHVSNTAVRRWLAGSNDEPAETNSNQLKLF